MDKENKSCIFRNPANIGGCGACQVLVEAGVVDTTCYNPNLNHLNCPISPEFTALDVKSETPTTPNNLSKD